MTNLTGSSNGPENYCNPSSILILSATIIFEVVMKLTSMMRLVPDDL